MVRVPIWFNADEMKQLKEKCEGCGQSPYGYIKELVMLDLNKDAGNIEQRRMVKVEERNIRETGESKQGIITTVESGLPY